MLSFRNVLRVSLYSHWNRRLDRCSLFSSCLCLVRHARWSSITNVVCERPGLVVDRGRKYSCIASWVGLPSVRQRVCPSIVSLGREMVSDIGLLWHILYNVALDNLAAIRFWRMCALWLRKDHVSIDRRVHLYKAFVPLALLYNCCTWGATKACMSRLDAFHWGALLGIGEHSLALGSTPWHWRALLGIGEHSLASASCQNIQCSIV